MESITKSINLSHQYEEEEDCIICVKRTDANYAREKGRQKIWSAAQMRKDEVYMRLLSLKDPSEY